MRDNKKAILVGLGSNKSSVIGSPMQTLLRALQEFNEQGLRILRISRFFRSPAWPDPSDPAFVNAVAAIETALTPVDLMAMLHAIESELGRMRSVRNAPRTLDLDIIDFAGLVSEGGNGPVLPHPKAHERAFVLAPLLDVAPDWIHPVPGRTGRALLDEAEKSGFAATPIENVD